MVKKALVVVTSISKYEKQNIATGLWLGQAVHFYEKLSKAGFHIDFVSPLGGNTPIDPNSLKTEVMTPADWHYYADLEFRNKLGNTLKPSQVNAADYDCIYYAGGHGTIWDFNDNKQLQEISAKIYEKGGVISSVCHGAIGLFNIRGKDGELLVKGKKITGFSNQEENLVGLDTHVPYLTEDQLVKRGADYSKAEKPFTSFAIADKNVVTGQNPQSAGAVGDLVVNLLK